MNHDVVEKILQLMIRYLVRLRPRPPILALWPFLHETNDVLEVYFEIYNIANYCLLENKTSLYTPCNSFIKDLDQTIMKLKLYEQ